MVTAKWLKTAGSTIIIISMKSTNMKSVRGIKRGSISKIFRKPKKVTNKTLAKMRIDKQKDRAFYYLKMLRASEIKSRTYSSDTSGPAPWSRRKMLYPRS